MLTAVAPRQMQVLHVEDDAAVAEMYKLGVEHAGFRVTLAPDAAMALRLASVCRFDLVLLDMQLPGMDGIQLLRELRLLQELTRELPIAVLSNSDPGDPEIARVEELGVLACLVKTQTTPAVLVQRIRGWLPSDAERRVECA